MVYVVFLLIFFSLFFFCRLIVFFFFPILVRRNVRISVALVSLPDSREETINEWIKRVVVGDAADKVGAGLWKIMPGVVAVGLFPKELTEQAGRWRSVQWSMCWDDLDSINARSSMSCKFREHGSYRVLQCPRRSCGIISIMCHREKEVREFWQRRKHDQLAARA